jgi:hypothetical protein
MNRLSKAALAQALVEHYDGEMRVEVSASNDGGLSATVSGPAGTLFLAISSRPDRSAILRHGLGLQIGRDNPVPSQRETEG